MKRREESGFEETPKLRPKLALEAEPATEVRLRSMYRIQPGDTLENLAQRLKGLGVALPEEEIVRQLLAANRTPEDVELTPAVVLSRELLFIPQLELGAPR